MIIDGSLPTTTFSNTQPPKDQTDALKKANRIACATVNCVDRAELKYLQDTLLALLDQKDYSRVGDLLNKFLTDPKPHS